MNSFLELLPIYSWSLPASVVMAVTLALIGGQWVSRERSAQIFVLGQGTSLGIVSGLVLNILLSADIHFLNLTLGFCLGAATLLLSDRLIEKRGDRNHIYLTLFIFFLSVTYLLTALTPSLETHMAASYFGDLAVMSNDGAKLSLGAAFVFLFFMLRTWRNLTQVSFQMMNQSLLSKNPFERVFDIGTLVITTLAIQNMGYLFSVGSLFIGTSFASAQSRGLREYTLRAALIAFAGTLGGFCLSLFSSELPTVPCILLAQILCGVISGFIGNSKS